MSRPCESCGTQTDLRCTDCAIDTGGREIVPLCGKPACVDLHERARNCRPCNPEVVFEAPAIAQTTNREDWS